MKLAPARRRLRRRVAVGAVATLVGVALVVFFVVPGRVDDAMNRVRPGPAYTASERARALHAQLTVVDLHADSLLWGRDLLERGTRGHADVPRLVEGNVALQAFTIVTKAPRHQNIDRNDDDTDNVTLLAVAQAWPPRTWTSLTERALYQARRLDDFARRSGGKLTVIHTASELRAYLARRAQESDVTAGFLGVEGAQALDGDLGNLDRLFDAGVRMMAPTHFTDNDIGGSASGAAKTGLTAKGEELVRRMQDRGMLVDLAHASPRTIDDVLAVATRPVVVSHTGVRATCDNARNLTDAQLAAVARTGGVIGIGYFTQAVCVLDARSIARAIRHAVSVAGIDHGLGSDFDGATTTPFDAAGLVQVTDALLAEGFGEAEVRAIAGGNALRVLEAVLPP